MNQLSMSITMSTHIKSQPSISVTVKQENQQVQYPYIPSPNQSINLKHLQRYIPELQEEWPRN